MSIEVLTTDEVSQLSYQVIGRGSTIEAGSVNFDNAKKYILEIQPTLMMIPKAQIVVYYLTKEGEIISDNIEVEFGNELVNNVSFKFSCGDLNFLQKNHKIIDNFPIFFSFNIFCKNR